MGNIIYQREDIETYLGMIVGLILVAMLCAVLFKYVISPIKNHKLPKLPMKYKVIYQIIPFVVIVCMVITILVYEVDFASKKFNSVYNLKVCEGELQILSVEEHKNRDGSLDYTCSLEIGDITFSKRNNYSPEEFAVFSTNPYVRVYYVMNYKIPYVWKIEQISA